MAITDDQRVYRREECVVFRKTNEQFGGLSNMAPGYPLEVNGTKILTVEALYQACRFPHRPELQREIIAEKSPMTAKMKSKPHRGDSRPDWLQVRVSVMRWCLAVKLVQNWDKFSSLLMETGDRPIVEESGKDPFWGAQPTPAGTLVGANVLGELLMDLRSKVKSRLGKGPLLAVEPPPIDNLCLLGVFVAQISGGLNNRPSSSSGQPGQSPLGMDAESCFDPIEAGQPARAEHPYDPAKMHGMIPKECKRLAEVDFPIQEVSKYASQEKSGPKGHISSMHLWWARRPLGSSRATLLAMLLPDPVDTHCPQSFKSAARHELDQLPGFGVSGPDDAALRRHLLKFVGLFASWPLSSDAQWIEVARRLITAANGAAPVVCDPFAGGGSIPLEAARLGCETIASDLNPVACLLLRTLLKDMPCDVDQAATLRSAGDRINTLAKAHLLPAYPVEPDGARPIAYTWARTVQCESPRCGAEIPLLRSLWLSKKPKRLIALRLVVSRNEASVPSVSFEVFSPSRASEVGSGTVSLAKATCPCCGSIVPPERVRAQLASQHGGANPVFDQTGQRVGGAKLIAVISSRPGHQLKNYRVSAASDYEPVKRAIQMLAESSASSPLSTIPDEPLPPIGTLGFRVQRYGVLQWGQLFTSRQLLALVTFERFLTEEVGLQPAITRMLALAFSRMAMCGMSLTNWNASAEKMQHTFGRQALPLVWDFAEVVPTHPAPGSWINAVELVAEVTESCQAIGSISEVGMADARHSHLPNESCSVWFTDPPYYDAVPYADLSDFFYVWLHRLSSSAPQMQMAAEFSSVLTPKDDEIVQDKSKTLPDGRRKDTGFFEEGMSQAFAEGRRVVRDDGIASVVFAHKTTEGWEALIGGLIDGGWTVTASWPIATEMASRLRARDSAALGTSIHLICRPRPTSTPPGEWAGVYRELPSRVADWMDRLETEGVRGADLVFACIGPALELYSRYSQVLDAEDRPIPLGGDPEAAEPHKRGYLAYVWETVARAALEKVLGSPEALARNGSPGALEEDARLTALFLWTLQSAVDEVAPLPADSREDEEPEEEDEEGASAKPKKKKGFTLVYDVARRFCQPLGIHLDDWKGRIIEVEKGAVRLLPVSERASQLFGDEAAEAMSGMTLAAAAAAPAQMTFALGDELAAPPPVRASTRKKRDDATMAKPREATTLDRIHAAMLLQKSGQANSLRALLQSESQKGREFLRLANALSALYPKGSEEKRLLDAMLLAVPK